MWNKWKEWLSGGPDLTEFPTLDEIIDHRYKSSASAIQAAQDLYDQQQNQYKAMQNAYQNQVVGAPWMSGTMGGSGLLSGQEPKNYSFDLSDMAIREAIRRMMEYQGQLEGKRSLRRWRDEAQRMTKYQPGTLLKYGGQPVQPDPYVTWTDNNTGNWYYSK